MNYRRKRAGKFSASEEICRSEKGIAESDFFGVLK